MLAFCQHTTFVFHYRTSVTRHTTKEEGQQQDKVKVEICQCDEMGSKVKVVLGLAFIVTRINKRLEMDELSCFQATARFVQPLINLPKKKNERWRFSFALSRWP